MMFLNHIFNEKKDKKRTVVIGEKFIDIFIVYLNFDLHGIPKSSSRNKYHFVKIVRISGRHAVRMPENTDQKNSKYFLHSVFCNKQQNQFIYSSHSKP